MTIQITRQAVLCVLVAALALGAGCQTASSRKTETHTTELYAPLTGVMRLEIATDIGDITVKSADTDQCQIVARVSAQACTEGKAGALAEKVPVSVTSLGNVLRISVLSPSVFGVNPYHIDLTIVAPRNLELDCRTEVGDILTAGFDKEVAVRTNVGNILCTDLRAGTQLHTDVGDIRAVYEDTAPAAVHAEMTTGVGSIALEGPARIFFLVRALGGLQCLKKGGAFQVSKGYRVLRKAGGGRGS